MTHLGASGMWPHAEVVNLTHKGVIAAPKWAQVAPLRVASRLSTLRFNMAHPGATGRICIAVITPRLMDIKSCIHCITPKLVTQQHATCCKPVNGQQLSNKTAQFIGQCFDQANNKIAGKFVVSWTARMGGLGGGT